ncbi:RagB/SusD family nutrient uptake outer membrane protein [Butyricimonas synergistica]|uniref:RagB/SusD family nutrient uptake outer membrane protein n=2 Tax=Butyricimonas synergistica TaxID=544644 RepID=UPI00036E7E3B|nr:RagB/SusD family nutrient uptake outer membrane protein [Butyricimonas synergistica]
MKMKRLIQWLLAAMVMTSCNDWLDIKSDNVLLEEEIFGDYTGVQMAVNGVYREISVTDLYGKNLSWGFASALALNYINSGLSSDLAEASNRNWKNSSVLDVTEKTWAKAYNVIASCNNIIQQVEKKDSSFFYNKDVEKQLILAEMRGVRALLHFDMLRLFCPVPSSKNQGDPAIPYVTKYPDHQPMRMTMEQVLENIVSDMEFAQEKLGPLDTLKFEKWTKGRQHRFMSGAHETPLGGDDFLNYRGTRMNYWGATALLARIYMWMGNEEMAYKNAAIIKRFVDVKGWFKWTGASQHGDVSAYPEYSDPKRWEELLLGFYNKDNLDNFEKAILSPESFKMNEMEKLFGSETDDYRYKFYNRYDNDRRYLVWERPVASSSNTSGTVTTQITYQCPLIPIVRFPEMYHIMIECLINKKKIVEAKELFSTLRNQRGVKEYVLPDDPDDLKEKLVNDMIREGLTEGQTFFMYKRLNHGIFNGDKDIPMTADKFIAEYPNNETSY